MPEGVFIFDRNGVIVEFNTPAQKLFGREVKALRGLNLQEVASWLDVRTDGKRVEFPNMAVSRALRGEVVRHERRILYNAETGNSYEVVVSANPMHNHDKEVIGALVVIRDITELQQLQKRLADTDRHLAIGQMAAGIAHDVNNVLSTISQAAAVLEHKADVTPSDRKLYFGLIQNAVRQGAEIVQRIREYIRGGTGERVPINIGSVLHEAMELTKPLWADVRDRHIDVRYKLAQLPLVQANAADLRRVFANLIINAIDAMPQGGVLTIESFPSDHSANVRISDTGVGIAPEQQKKIFLPYYTTKTKGTGLGLAMAQRIVESLGGCIEFKSELGQGATFTIRLPAVGSKHNDKQEEKAA